MQNYIRVVADSTADNEDDLRAVLGILFAEIAGTSEAVPLVPHTKGGFSLVLNYPDDQAQAVVEILVANGWRPCF